MIDPAFSGKQSRRTSYPDQDCVWHHIMKQQRKRQRRVHVLIIGLATLSFSVGVYIGWTGFPL